MAGHPTRSLRPGEFRSNIFGDIERRLLGYYALPLLWREHVIGWGNLSVADGALRADVGFVGSRPRERAFTRELAAELDRMRLFLGLEEHRL